MTVRKKHTPRKQHSASGFATGFLGEWLDPFAESIFDKCVEKVFEMEMSEGEPERLRVIYEDRRLRLATGSFVPPNLGSGSSCTNFEAKYKLRPARRVIHTHKGVR
jgi:hypothetical protein